MTAEFEDFGTQLARFQGGAIILHGWGCPSCGHGFWVEDDTQRAADPTSLGCPRCGANELREALLKANRQLGGILIFEAVAEHDPVGSRPERIEQQIGAVRGVYRETRRVLAAQHGAEGSIIHAARRHGVAPVSDRSFRRVAGECPMGCGRTLFLGEDGHVTCSLLGCSRPSAADERLVIDVGYRDPWDEPAPPAIEWDDEL